MSVRALLIIAAALLCLLGPAAVAQPPDADSTESVYVPTLAALAAEVADQRAHIEQLEARVKRLEHPHHAKRKRSHS